jgi:hypothetical protein
MTTLRPALGSEEGRSIAATATATTTAKTDKPAKQRQSERSLSCLGRGEKAASVERSLKKRKKSRCPESLTSTSSITVIIMVARSFLFLLRNFGG